MMSIRFAEYKDIETLVQIDQNAYGQYGASFHYFEEKLSASHTCVLVVEENEKVTGFTVVEFLNADDLPRNFTDFYPAEKLLGPWMHIIAFTTESNYIDKKEDTRLVQAVEEVSKARGCVSSCVPLTKNHPFEKNGVFEFWGSNGYSLSGEISWMVNDHEKLECFFYKKDV